MFWFSLITKLEQNIHTFLFIHFISFINFVYVFFIIPKAYFYNLKRDNKHIYTHLEGSKNNIISNVANAMTKTL